MSKSSNHTRFHCLLWNSGPNQDKIVAGVLTGRLAVYLTKHEAERGVVEYKGQARVAEFLARCKDRNTPFPGVGVAGEVNGNR